MPRSQHHTITKLTQAKLATLAKIDALKQEQNRVEAQLRAAARRERQQRQSQLGRLVDEAGLADVDVETLTQLFAIFGKVAHVPGELKGLIEQIEAGQMRGNT